MSRTKARCLNPACGFVIENWRAGTPPPKRCPRCGYEGSKMDLEHTRAIAEGEARAQRDGRRRSRIAALREQALMALPWWRRWLVGLGLAERPGIRWHRFEARPGVPVEICADCWVVERTDGENHACEGRPPAGVMEQARKQAEAGA